MEIGKLMDIGFSENQAKVYIALLKNPGRSAGEISKELSVDRSFIYNILESLMKKGLVFSSLKKSKKIFFSEKPGKIIENFEHTKSKVKTAVKELEKLKSSKQGRSNFEIFEGKFALKKYLSELIISDKFLTLGGGGNLNIFNILKYEHPHYFKSLKKSKTRGKVICSKENAEFWKKNLKDTKIEIRCLKGAGRENSITIFKDKLLISSETENPRLSS